MTIVFNQIETLRVKHLESLTEILGSVVQQRTLWSGLIILL